MGSSGDEKSGQRMVRGAGKADWKEVCSDGIDPAAQAGTREEVGKKPWHG